MPPRNVRGVLGPCRIREFVARGYRMVRLGSSKSERRALRIYRRTGGTTRGPRRDERAD